MTASQVTEAASSTPVKRVKYPSVWLDLLPLDICARIAALLPHHHHQDESRLQQLPDALALAAASSAQCLAIGTTQSHLCIEKANNTDHTIALIRAWRCILHHIQSVHLPIDVFDNKDVTDLLSLPTIRKAVIPNYPGLLRALHTGRSVKQLELRLTIYCPENGKNGLATGVSKLLHECPIEQLRLLCLGCNSCPRATCFAAHVLQPMKEGPNCTTLRSLYVKCTSEQMEPLTQTAAFFPNLQEFRLEHWTTVDHFFLDRPVALKLTDDMFTALRGVKSVEMLHCGGIKTFIPELASNLTALSSVITATKADVTKLETCPKLRSLDIVLRKRTEVCFPLNLGNLRSLSLTWNPDSRPPLFEQHYAPRSDVICGIVRRNKHMTELRLQNMMMTKSTLEEVLRSTGGNLRVLHVPIFHQDESAERRLCRLAKLIVQYNHNLEELEICSASFGRVAKLPVLMAHEAGVCDPNRCHFCSLRCRIDGVLKVFKRRLVRFRDDGIKRLLLTLEPWR